jgi:hypothetical protein
MGFGKGLRILSQTHRNQRQDWGVKNLAEPAQNRTNP